MSQAIFRCTICGYAGNADINAAKNIRAAGYAVIARGGLNWVDEARTNGARKQVAEITDIVMQNQ